MLHAVEQGVDWGSFSALERVSTGPGCAGAPFDAIVRAMGTSDSNSSRVIAVHRCVRHTFSKPSSRAISLLAGLGVEGDAHCGETVKHRSRVRADPTQPNLRQVHLIHSELIDQLQDQGFRVLPGTMGENITTRGLDLLSLPRGAVLRIGSRAAVEVTGLRNPCKQLDDYQQGLLAAVLDRSESGELIRKAGVMGVVLESGRVNNGDTVEVILPAEPHLPLERV